MTKMRSKPVFAVLSVLLPISSQAALYQVIKIESPTYSEESYGVVIGQELGSVDCFSDSCTDSSYDLVGETLDGNEGLSFKEEVAFGMDSQFYYLDYDDLESYCESELGYATCENWAYNRWYGNTDTDIGGLQNEREAYYEASYQANSTVFTESETLMFQPDVGSAAPSQDDYSYEFVDGTDEKVVNSIDENGFIIGNTSSGYYDYNSQYIRMYRSRGYYNSDSGVNILEPKADTDLTLSDESGEQNIISQMGSTMAFDSFTYNGSTYIVGSGSVATFYYDDEYKDYDSGYTSYSDEEDVTNCVEYADPALYPECQNFGFATRGFIWNMTDDLGPNDSSNHFWIADWETDTTGTYHEYNDDEASAQASVRAAVISEVDSYESLPVLVGYNTQIDDYDNFLLQAAIFRPSTTSSFKVEESAWTTTFIENTTVEIDGDYIHSHSVATDINQNLVVIGNAKRDGDYPYEGMIANRMFIADGSDETPSAIFFNAQDESIFFDSAGGNARSINNFNEIVGQVDAEDHREVDGDERRHRGFIYAYDDTGTDSTRRSRFNNQAWWLDDLTNGGDYSDSNNHFRITDASDINDAGVISATAIQCFSDETATSSMEYDSTEHFAYCNDGYGDERIVAVQLLPITGSDSSNITERVEDSSVTSRSGATMSWALLLWMSVTCLIRRINLYSAYNVGRLWRVKHLIVD